MLIRDQLKRSFVAIAWAILLAIVLFVIMYARWLEMAGARTWAHEVLKVVFQCHVLGTEQVTFSNPRSQEQYTISSKRLGELLAQPPGPLRSQSAVQEIASRKLMIDQLLRRETGLTNSATLLEQDTMLHGQIVLYSTTMVTAAELLYTYADRIARRLRFWTLNLNVLALILLGLTTGFAFYQANRSLVGPLHQMALGAQRLGAGELGYRLGIERSDELGTLAKSMNGMAERLAKRQSELEEKLKDLDTFCYSLAHDLKAPLRTVTGFGELLELDHATELAPEARAYIAAMRKATIKMAALIDDLLAYGALTHQEFLMERVNLSALVKDCVSDLEDDSRVGGIRIISQDIPAVWGNKPILRQALTNLLTNAFKFVPPDRTPFIEIRSVLEDNWCKLLIRDNGIGIAREHQRTIFGLFQRLHRDTDYPGTGVGLAMVEKGIHLLGGTVGVESEVGQGSTFWIRLRRAPEELPSRSAST